MKKIALVIGLLILLIILTLAFDMWTEKSPLACEFLGGSFWNHKNGECFDCPTGCNGNIIRRILNFIGLKKADILGRL